MLVPDFGKWELLRIKKNTVSPLSITTTCKYFDDERSFSGWYSDILYQRKDTLSKISTYLVADAYFSKKPFLESDDCGLDGSQVNIAQMLLTRLICYLHTLNSPIQDVFGCKHQ
jgi:hypothetical protein